MGSKKLERSLLRAVYCVVDWDSGILLWEGKRSGEEDRRCIRILVKKTSECNAMVRGAVALDHVFIRRPRLQHFLSYVRFVCLLARTPIVGDRIFCFVICYLPGGMESGGWSR